MSLLEERVQEGDGLNSLAQSHLVRQDRVYVLSPRVPQPIDTLQLVRVQLHTRVVQKRRLLFVLLAQIGGGFLGRWRVASRFGPGGAVFILLQLFGLGLAAALALLLLAVVEVGGFQVLRNNGEKKVCENEGNYTIQYLPQ